MNTHADKIQDNKSQADNNSSSLQDSKDSSTFSITDNRPEMIVQQKIKRIISDNPQPAKWKTYQKLANSNSQATQFKTYQRMADNYYTKTKAPIQFKTIALKKTEVSQGNGKGKTIPKDKGEVLFTTDMVGCIAILGVGTDNCFMIHSDNNGTSGIGKVTLEDGLKGLGVGSSSVYTIYLIGGESSEGLQSKQDAIQQILPSCTINKIGNYGSAYLTGDGVYAITNSNLKEKLGVDTIEYS